MKEPIVHSQVTDTLPDDDSRAHRSIDCAHCGVMLHAFNNENMRTWLDTGMGPLCLTCFAKADEEFMDDELGLPDDWRPE